MNPLDSPDMLRASGLTTDNATMEGWLVAWCVVSAEDPMVKPIELAYHLAS